MNVRLSSYKHDFGLDELLSTKMSKFWNTDDNLPHFIELSFRKKTYIEEVHLFLSFSDDDSYTPEVLEIWSGLTREKMKMLRVCNAFEPEGAISMHVGHDCFFVYVIIRANHQEGRDSHVRHLKVYGKNNKEIFYIK
ncbi:hypothetical protein GVAV_000123 [Gurleya vavrai]